MVLITSDKKEEEEFNSEIRRDFGFHNYVRFFAQLIYIISKILEKESPLSRGFLCFTLIRLALDLARVPYVDHTIQLADWPSIKSKGLAEGSLPFGQLPLLKINGLNLIQSTSILRYLSRKYISPEADEALQATIDMMIEGWDDVLSGYFDHLFSSPGVLKSWLYNECDTLLDRLEHYYRLHKVFYIFGSGNEV
ncbi:uncharacterized protein [Blastocystis hominis]|uniref:GST N-terminal domain-containing protein n=1 Tax=Blastocystis hominis TaxID=12968 RepID=D8M3V9_BLAHO|nr:uncharacterized protein [Blastocystis hominis]CBK22582.2 unnamed protein product [Blastocystis hominis]|eukprot:XP_012896630.1 uncharacterized protein [Blastocystis hominis]